jgi:hypothetical protein
MSKITSNASRLVRASLLIAPALAAIAMPAIAQTLTSEGPGPVDPIIQQSEWNAGPNQFFVNSNLDRELISFKSPHNLKLCATGARITPLGRRIRGFPIKVSYDGQSTVVQPGSCTSFEAQRVTVAAASQLPGRIVLMGTVSDADQPAG